MTSLASFKAHRLCQKLRANLFISVAIFDFSAGPGDALSSGHD
jgi:hypothetical protein